MRQTAAELAVVGAQVLTPTEDGPRWRRLDLYSSAGRITELRDPSLPSLPARETVNAAGRVLLPGLVNAHTHSSGQLCRLSYPRDVLECWLVDTLGLSRGMTAEDAAVAAQMHAADALRNGVTTLLDHARLVGPSVAAVLGAYRQSGIRVVLAPQLTDLKYSEGLPDIGPSLRTLLSEADAWPARTAEAELELCKEVLEQTAGRSRLSVLLGPSAPERCSDRLLEGVGRLAADAAVGIHTHLLESRLQASSGDAVGRLERIGLLGPATSVAHAVHLDHKGVRTLARHSVSVVHSPLCNLALGSGRSGTSELLRARITLGLGTDAHNSAGVQDLLSTARLALSLNRSELPPAEWLDGVAVWRMATEGGARALGLETEVGRLAPGHRADVLIVDPGAAGWLRAGEPAEEIVFSGFGAGLETVFVDGLPVYARGRPLNIDQLALLAEAAAAIRRLAKGEATAVAARLHGLVHEVSARVHPAHA